MRKFFNKSNLFSTTLSIALSFVFVASVTFASTTISTNITTDGTLSVTGASTLTGAVTVAGVHIDNGQFQASSTALFGSAVTAYSTFAVTGASTFTGLVTTGFASTSALSLNGTAANLMVNGRATTTASNGNIETLGGLTVGSATTNSLTGTILLSAQASDPTGVTQGTFYYNSTNKTLKMFDGTNWFTVGTTTAGLTLVSPRIQLSDLTTQYLTLGTTTQPQGTSGQSLLTVEATTTTAVPLTLVGFASQTGHLFDVVNSGGTKLLYVNSGGGLFGSSTAQLTGTLTTYGNTVLGDAASDVITVTGNASTTNAFTVGTTLYVGGNATTTSAGAISTQGSLTVIGATLLNGAVTLGDAAADAIVVTGNASTTNALTVGTTLYVGGNATTTGSSGNFGTLGKVGVGTTSPTTLEVSADGTATTTVGVFSSGSLKGGCIQLSATNGTLYRMYISATDNVSTSTNGHTGQIAIWEAGSCK